MDTSGSMGEGNKLSLIKESLNILLKQLKPNDTISIVAYSADAKLILEPTQISKEDTITKAIESLSTSSSTNVEAGLRLGYKQAQSAYKPGGINRVILCSDGVTNTGITDPNKILDLIKQESEGNIFLSVVGVGFDNYNDELLEKLAVRGDGYYAYVDSVREAIRVFVENATDTLQVIAKDAKIQVEFNPKVVKQFRLIGYENKVLENQDFRNDKVDAGEIGAGHSVTAIYELALQESPPNDKIADVSLRFKDVDALNTPIEMTKSISTGDIINDYNTASVSFRLSAVVALYAEILRGSYWARDKKFEDALALAKNVDSELKSPKKTKELVSIIEKAISIKK